jgi:hypothetical protein
MEGGDSCEWYLFAVNWCRDMAILDEYLMHDETEEKDT